jgi:Subtilase family
LLLIAAAHSPDETTVVVIEQQLGLPQRGTPLVPVEIEPAIAAIIRAMFASGMTVVEAAGNGRLDLDSFVDGNGRSVTRASDTGAIMVGACLDPGGVFPCGFRPRQRAAFSNYGGRVDCYASGLGVMTTRTTGAGGPTAAYRGFGGTSAAAAIAAGAAAALQGMAGRTTSHFLVRSPAAF